MQSDSDNEKSCNHVPDYKIESDSEEEEYTQNNATIAKPDLQVIYDKASKTNTATLASKANNLSNKLDSKSTKLIMQQKQIRQLTITLEKERLKSRELMDQIHRTTPEATKQTSKETPLTSDISSKNEVKQLKQSLIQINRKLTDERIKTTSLNADLKTAEKLLKQETGLSLTELLKEKESNWKGRSETIILLREKIRDLSNCSNTLPTPESINTRAIRKIENGKKNEMLKIVSEFDELKIKYEDLKSKYNASVSRGIALDRNIKELKGHATFLVQKSDRDDLLIKTLEERVSFNVPGIKTSRCFDKGKNVRETLVYKEDSETDNKLRVAYDEIHSLKSALERFSLEKQKQMDDYEKVIERFRGISLELPSIDEKYLLPSARD